MDKIKFYNGHEMPRVGLGTFRVENNDDCTKAVKHAIENGYRALIQQKFTVMKKK